MKYTPELGRALCKLVETYGFIAPCARAMGLKKDTVYEWRDRSEAGDAKFAGFAEQLRIAQGKWEQRTLKKVTDPRWLLERMDPETYGPPKQPETVVNVNQTATMVPFHEALEQAVERLKKE